EGAMEGLASIGFSLANYAHDADFMQYEAFIRKIISYALSEGMPKHTCFNVNIPNVAVC
ncbi:5'/3'-nucleotidase SurE, partial [bacterium]|nr:5'/3'-nucleotidase SurE [bacterium]